MKPPTVITLHLPIGHTEDDLREAVTRRSGGSSAAVEKRTFRILRRSLDARDKKQIHWVYRIELNPEPIVLNGIASLIGRKIAASPDQSHPAPVVIGSGPAGLFAALYLAQAGLRPLIIERGKPVDQRAADVNRFWAHGLLDPGSNVQFGEGGAGTFSDGKLTTGIKDRRCRVILEELVLAGAPEEIIWLAKPHIGTDLLRQVVQNLRRRIIALGGSFRFSCRLSGLATGPGGLKGLVCVEKGSDGSEKTVEIAAARAVLAIGHSARDTFSLLHSLKMPLAGKPFSIGVRIEHLQTRISKAQYGSIDNLPPADYKLSCHLDNGRSVYTFCMCPGGQVIGASSEENSVVTNGMSHFARDGRNANSAVLVSVTPGDFPGEGPLAGLFWQRELEQRAFQLGGGTYAAPAQRLGDFLRQDRLCNRSGDWMDTEPTYRPGITWCDLADVLPPFVSQSLVQALPVFDRRLHGFADPGAVLTGVETRSSSPLRILRNAQLESGLSGLYPAGEGAGYAGGIMSAALDGLRCAEALLLKSS